MANSAENVNKKRKAKSFRSYSGYMLFYMIATVLTKIIGFFREIAITYKFGYGPVSDGYILGFSVPDLVYSILIGGAIGAAVTPILSSAIERDEEEKVWPTLSTFFTTIMIAFAVFLVLGEVFSPQIISFLNPDKEAEVISIATSVSRVIYIQTFFFILIAIITSVLSSNKVFGLPAFGVTIYNIVGLISVLVFGASNKAGAVKVAWGIVFAALLYFLYLNHFAKPFLGNYRPRLNFKDKRFWYILSLAIPALLSGTVRQLNTIVQQRYTSQFTGAVTSLKNATTLFNLPYQIIAVSIGGFLLPNISGYLARGANKDASDFLSKSIRITIFLVLPFALVFFIFPGRTVQAVFQWNTESYTNANVMSTASLLRIYAIDLIIVTFTYFINQLFYALQKNYYTLISAVISLASNFILCEIFINRLGFGIKALGVATLIADIIVLIYSLVILSRIAPNLEIESSLSYVVKLATTIIFTLSTLNLVDVIMPSTASKLLQLLQYVLIFVIGFIAYLASAYFLQMDEVRSSGKMLGNFFSRFKAKKKQKKVGKD